MQIKTIRYRLDACEDFDREVNLALKEGWTLTNRYILEGKQLCDDTYTHNMLIAELAWFEEIQHHTPTIEVKYFDQELDELEKFSVGDWIDLRASVDIEMKAGELKFIPLGVGMILPDGYEAHMLPRSSTAKNFSIIMANSMGIIDNSYSGDDDMWHFPAVALRDTKIYKGDRIAQFRIMENQPPVGIVKVDKLNDISRGGLGSTGTK